MGNGDIKSTLREFIKANFMVAMEFADDDSFLEHGIIDSLGIIDLMGFIETQYGFRPATQEMIPENFDSLERLSRYIAAQLSESDS